ncbi:PIG-L deacetylase family protein [Neomicrococcus lactis]|uniref:4-oxalomesaconate hydratase n=1 Tax=Neomicrococcus lactis TaxID=732241 RepID=A0A7W8Y923_9MICC|nr:PIG-L deacetylase family protein [Neomicrococcus lactis]MBB5597091.1 4-oxalomesaconate hydratase [Neomicrococcus lactis]
MAEKRMLVVGAHSADFVWRSAGAVATFVREGGEALVVALSYGERGESGELWKQEGQTEENVKKIRHGEAERASQHLGASFQAFDLGDYPLLPTHDAVLQLADLMREYAPTVVLTHPDKDPFNPDHPVAHQMVQQARLMTSGAGVESAFKTAPPSEFLVFEPHQPELCGFVPTVFVDITEAFEQKKAAMAEMKAQQYLQSYYAERAEHRGNHARKATGNKDIRQAEAFQRLIPQVVRSL